MAVAYPSARVAGEIELAGTVPSLSQWQSYLVSMEPLSHLPTPNPTTLSLPVAGNRSAGGPPTTSVTAAGGPFCELQPRLSVQRTEADRSGTRYCVDGCESKTEFLRVSVSPKPPAFGPLNSSSQRWGPHIPIESEVATAAGERTTGKAVRRSHRRARGVRVRTFFLRLTNRY